VIARDPSDPDKVGGMYTKEHVAAIVAFERGL
jgi:hypothetical protein